MIAILNNFDFAIIGGDKRLFYLAKYLHKQNFKVIGLNLANSKDEKINFLTTNSLKEAILTAKHIVGPIPFSRNDDLINCNFNFANLKINDFIKYLNKKNIVFAGNLSKKVLNCIKTKTELVYDYFKNENFAVFNAMLTAESAIAEIILKNSFNLNSSDCLILGFGRCGKLLALKLKNFCNTVTVCSKNQVDLTWAKAMGFQIIKLKNLKNNIKKFNLIVNTIPVNLLTGEILNKLKKNVFVYDITPNGIDLNEFKNASIKAEISLQIPGKFKFKAAATCLADIIIKILKKNKKI